MGAYRKTVRRGVRTGQVAYAGLKLAKKLYSKRRKTQKTIRQRKSFKSPEIYSKATDGITRSYTNHYRKPNKKLLPALKGKSIDIKRSNSSNTLINDFGVQNPKTMAAYGLGSDWLQIYDDAVRVSTNYANAHLDGPNTRSKRLFVHHVTQRTTFVNQSPSMIRVTLYDLLAKKMATTTPEQSWSIGLSQNAGTDPSQEVTIHPTSSPRDSKLFSAEWRIVKTTKIVMATGAAHDHVFKNTINGLVNLAWCADNSAEYNPSKYMATMVVVQGLPVDDNVTWTDIQNVTTDKSKLISVTQQEIKSRVLDGKGDKLTYVNVMPATMAFSFSQNPDSAGVHDTTANSVAVAGSAAFS